MTTVISLIVSIIFAAIILGIICKAESWFQKKANQGLVKRNANRKLEVNPKVSIDRLSSIYIL